MTVRLIVVLHMIVRFTAVLHMTVRFIAVVHDSQLYCCSSYTSVSFSVMGFVRHWCLLALSSFLEHSVYQSHWGRKACRVVINWPVIHLAFCRFIETFILEVENWPVKLLAISRLNATFRVEVDNWPVKTLAISSFMGTFALEVENWPVKSLAISRFNENWPVKPLAFVTAFTIEVGSCRFTAAAVVHMLVRSTAFLDMIFRFTSVVHIGHNYCCFFIWKSDLLLLFTCQSDLLLFFM